MRDRNLQKSLRRRVSNVDASLPGCMTPEDKNSIPSIRRAKRRDKKHLSVEEVKEEEEG